MILKKSLHLSCMHDIHHWKEKPFLKQHVGTDTSKDNQIIQNSRFFSTASNILVILAKSGGELIDFSSMPIKILKSKLKKLLYIVTKNKCPFFLRHFCKS